MQHILSYLLHYIRIYYFFTQFFLQKFLLATPRKYVKTIVLILKRMSLAGRLIRSSNVLSETTGITALWLLQFEEKTSLTNSQPKVLLIKTNIKYVVTELH